MKEHQEHFGRLFYQDKKIGYWISIDYPRIRAHRWVWINIHGDIPKGYHIHHKDEDKSNNAITNLELIEASRHCRIHMTKEKREWASKWVEVIRPLTKAWHASEEGKKWHIYHAEKCKFGKWEPKTYKCEVCFKEYESTKRSGTRFCSNNCKCKFRWDSGIDNVTRICQKCGIEFTINKYAKTKNCSKKCAQKR